MASWSSKCKVMARENKVADTGVRSPGESAGSRPSQ
jgi:hypothetical protein